MSQSLWVAVSDSDRVDGSHDDTDWLRAKAAPLAFLCPRHIPDTSPEGRVHIPVPRGSGLPAIVSTALVQR